MQIKTEKISVELEGNEARDIAYHIKYSLSHSIETHWNTLQQNQDGESLFFERNARDLQIMKDLFYATSSHWVYDDCISQFKKMFEEKRKERSEKV